MLKQYFSSKIGVIREKMDIIFVFSVKNWFRNNYIFRRNKRVPKTCRPVLYKNKYIIVLTQRKNNEIFAFIAVLVFKFINRKDNRYCLKIG